MSAESLVVDQLQVIQQKSKRESCDWLLICRRHTNSAPARLFDPSSLNRRGVMARTTLWPDACPRACPPRYRHIDVVKAMLEVQGGMFVSGFPFIELMG
jgi:hypothetical protein